MPGEQAHTSRTRRVGAHQVLVLAERVALVRAWRFFRHRYARHRPGLRMHNTVCRIEGTVATQNVRFGATKHSALATSLGKVRRDRLCTPPCGCSGAGRALFWICRGCRPGSRAHTRAGGSHARQGYLGTACLWAAAPVLVASSARAHPRQRGGLGSAAVKLTFRRTKDAFCTGNLPKNCGASCSWFSMQRALARACPQPFAGSLSLDPLLESQRRTSSDTTASPYIKHSDKQPNRQHGW